MNYPIVYDKLETSFLGYGLAVLENVNDNFFIREVLNGEYSLTFTLPVNDPKWQYIVEENIVKVEGQLFVIRTISDARKENGEIVCDVTCEHIFFLLLDDYIEYLEITSGSSATVTLTQILAGTDHSVGTVDVTGTVTEDNAPIFEDVNPIKATNDLISLLGGEVKADNFTVNLLTHRGSTVPNIQFRYRKNIKSIRRTKDTSGLITRLYVYGNDGLTIEDAIEGNGLKYIDSQYIANYRRPKTASVHFDIDDPDELYTAGVTHLATVEIPHVSYEGEVLELKALDEYGPLEAFTLGDESMVFDEDLNIAVQARILEYERYPKQPWKSRVTLANFRPGIQNELSQLRDMKSQLVTQDGSMKVSTAWFEGVINTLQNQLIASGSYATAQVIEGKGLLFENLDEASPDYGGLYIGPGMMAIAKEKTGSPPTWNWRTFGTGVGFTGDLLLANTVRAGCLLADQALIDLLNAQEIVAGSVKAENIITSTAKITAAQIESLVVGGNVAMGVNATIDWSKVLNSPTIPDVPGYIQSTKISGTSIESCTITGNTVQTAGANNNRIVLAGTGFKCYNASNQLHGWVLDSNNWSDLLVYFEGQERGGLKLLGGALCLIPNNGNLIIGTGGRTTYLNGDINFQYAESITGLHAQWG